MADRTDNRVCILLADDNEMVRETLSFILTKHGYCVTAVKDGRAALDQIAMAHPDLIILDFAMPGMTGLQVCEHMRGDPAIRDIPVILLSGEGSIRQEVRRMRQAQILFIEKPCDTVELLDHVNRIIGRRKGR